MLDKDKLREKREKQAQESVNIWTSFLTDQDETKPAEKNQEKKDNNKK